MKLYTGTSGFSYKEWKGPFYPPKTPASKMLAYYAQHLGAVEMNNTFYRMPKAQTLQTWASQVPDTFRFAVKASRKITTFKRLKNVEEETAYLVGALDSLGDKLGIVLFQLPPKMTCDLARLSAFIELLPEQMPAVFEFRHESWNNDEVLEILRARGYALCLNDIDAQSPPPLVITGRYAYLRLRRVEYDDTQLAHWLATLQSASLAHAFVFFKHEDEATGPALAQRFMALAAQAE